MLLPCFVLVAGVPFRSLPRLLLLAPELCRRLAHLIQAAVALVAR